MRDKYGVTATSRVLHLASPTFDTAIVEVLAAAIHGATLVIAPATAFGGQELAAFLRHHRVTHLLATPSALATVDPDELDTVELVLVGGEPCPQPLVRRWAGGRIMRNAYGPTETTCSVTLAEPLEPQSPITLGPPMRGVRAVILDRNLHPLPSGASGELYLAGPALARGYHRRPALTAAKFVADPLGEPGSRMFRSSDQVRWTVKHELEFLGRADDQVKIRGLRIELGEIDSVLSNDPAVAFAATVVHSSPAGDPVLVTYVAEVEPAIVDVAALRGRARRSLPDYMVPAAITVVDSIPLTPTGKLDRAALPQPDLGGPVPHRNPQTAAERDIAEVFADVLGATRIGADHSFFDLGGDSLSATRVVARINDRWGTGLGVRDVFDAPTVAALAVRIGEPSPDATRPVLGEMELPDRIPLSPAQAYIDRTATAPALYSIPCTIRIRGGIDRTAFEQAVGDVLERHRALRTIYPDGPTGPYQHLLDVADVLPDLSPIPEKGDDATRAVLSAPFDVRTEPPLRIRVFEYARDEHVIACVFHHISVDGWSFATLAGDLTLAYAARAFGSAPQWPALQVDYSDYTMWWHAVLGDELDPSSRASMQIDFWEAELAGLRGDLHLPTDRPRPERWSYRAARLAFSLDPTVHAALLTSARTHHATLFTTLRAAVSILLTRLSGHTDVAIGSPVAGRGHPQLEGVVGMFVNTVVLRTRVTQSMTFDEVVAAARESELRAFAHSDVQFERLVEILDPPRSPALHPFFQVALSLENFTAAEFDIEGLHVEITPRPLDVAKCDLHFYFTERHDDTGAPSGIDAEVLYSTDLFDESTIGLFVKGLRDVLARAHRGT
nr:condensation domain-containing protein [Rhodococcus opacus]